MNRITHKQAQRYIRADLDGLLTPTQRLDLETHLRDCETCRADSDSFSTLTARLQTEFHSHWDVQDGPSQNVVANVQSRSRRIIMQKRIDLAFNIFGGIVTLLVLVFVISSIVSQLQKKSTASNGTQTNAPALPLSEERLIAFASEQDGNFEIYTMRANGSDLTNITNNPAKDVNPVWSPDGKRLAFESNRDGFMQIYLMNIDGSHVVQLTSDPADHAIGGRADSNSNPWSPDGNNLIISQRSKDNEQQWILYVINIGTGQKTQLFDQPANFWDSSWSPDGKDIAFIPIDSQHREASRLYLTDVDGGNLSEITKTLPADETWDDYPGYYWSRDGQSIIFITSNADYINSKGLVDDPNNLYKWSVYKAGLDGSLALQVMSHSPIGGWWDGNYFVTPLTRNTAWNWVRPDGISAVDPFHECQYAAGFSYGYKQSSNGNVAVGAMCSNGDWWLSWANAKGTVFSPLINSPIHGPDGGMNFSWSSDDKFLAVTMTTPKKSDMYILNVAESQKDPSIQPLKVSIGGGQLFYTAAWQPVANNDVAQVNPTPEPTKTSSYNGLIAFASENKNGASKNMDIYIMHADGSNITNLTNNPANDTSPAWSPDGKKIAFVSERNGNADIFIMNPDGSGVTQLTDNLGYDGNITWSPNGQKIAYVSGPNDPNAKSQLIIMNPDGSNKIVLTQEAGSYSFLSWPPDGQKIIYQKNGTDPNGSSANVGIYSVSIDGADQHELFKGGGILSMRWDDASNFSGIVYTQLDNGNWYLYRFNIDGTPALKLGGTNTSGSNAPIDGWFTEGSRTIYITKNTTTWFWHDNQKKVSEWLKWNFASSCKDYSPKDVYQHDADHVMSPDGKYLFVIVTCNEGVSRFYLVSANGSEIKELANISTPTSWQALDTAWSPDGKYIIMTSAVAFPSNQSAYMDFYLFDIEKMLNDPSTKPVQLTTDGAFKFSPVWQPQP